MPLTHQEVVKTIEGYQKGFDKLLQANRNEQGRSLEVLILQTEIEVLRELLKQRMIPEVSH